MTHISAVLRVLSDYEPHTLFEIRDIAELMIGGKASETGISARIRELRHKGYHVESYPQKKGSKTFLYRLVKQNITAEEAERILSA
jgi:biotin operon repressor